MEWLIRRYERSEEREWPDRMFEVKVLRFPQYFAAFEHALRTHPGRLHMSAYAITEVQKHERSAECALKEVSDTPATAIAMFRSAFWNSASAAFETDPIEEHHVRWSKLEPELLREFGPADASMVKLAQELKAGGEQSPCLITPDGPLRSRCSLFPLPIRVNTRDPWDLLGDFL